MKDSMKKIPFCTEVETSEVLFRVIALVQSAKKELLISSSKQDTSNVQPNSQYFDALRAKIKSGVRITRYVFGTRNFKSIDELGVVQLYSGTHHLYQRAVIADQSNAMFKFGESFYYSEYSPLIKALCLYFKQTQK